MSTTPIECLVVDDEPLAASLISSYVERTPFLHLVAQTHSAESALEILSGNNIDLVFLDIRMPGLSGMQLARLIPAQTRIVFTTAYSDHAVEGFRVNALDYLLKPVSYDEFLEAAKRAKDTLTPEITNIPAPPAPKSHILVKSEYRLLRIELASILYIEGLKDYVKIYIADEQNPVLSLMSIKSLEEELPDSFMRVHRSFIVNIEKIKVIERNSIILGNRAIPVSESYRTQFLQKIQN